MEEEESGEEAEETEESERAELAEAVEEAETEEEETVETSEKEEDVSGETEEEEVEAEEVPPVEEAKPPPREEKEEEFVEERIYTIPLGKAWIMPPNKRAPKAMRMIKAFVTKHMKLEAKKEEEGEEAEEEPRKLVISNDVNERIWRRGIEKPPRKVRIRAAKDKEGNVTVYLAEGD